MSDTTPERSSSDPGMPAPFAELVAELGELGFEPQPRPALAGQVVYTATDSPVTITVVTDPTHPHVRAEGAAGGRAPRAARRPPGRPGRPPPPPPPPPPHPPPPPLHPPPPP